MKEYNERLLSALPKIMKAQKYLSPISFSLLMRILYTNLQGRETISGVEFQEFCNISKNTVTRAVDELQQSSCVSVRRYSRSSSKYVIDLQGCECYIRNEEIKESEDSDNSETTNLKHNIRLPLNSSLRKLIFERDLYRCINCGTHKSLSVDHIVPVSKGGGNEIKNLQTLCTTCNSSKGGRPMAEWLEIDK